MATKALADWNRPSILAVWALYCLISYAIAIGGLTEIRDLLEEMAGQIVDLGLHQQAIAAHYSNQDMVLILFSAFTSADTLFAGLMDTEPFLSSDNFDVKPLAIRFIDLHQASLDELDHNEYFQRAGSELLDLQVASRFNRGWSTCLKKLRAVHVSDGHMIERSWAQLRYNWLQIRLNSLMLIDSTLAAHAYPHLCRAVSQILNCYTELHNLKQLNTSWPQLQRISTCGQILILCMAAGELHKLEAENLFNMLLCLIAEHRPAWPEAEMLLEGFRHAGRCLQIGLGPPVPFPRQDVGTILSIPHLPVGDLESWDDFLEVDTSLVSSTIVLPSASK
ncbi:hypothetical protein BCR39DRAFT_589368 [Naematelia encephala]|uniref:Fungal-specific transcription factor domain-domain-containing protein n=1 Tax=Naematelia encephala TaxID=71784 RepID=A0A1Y2AY12_9TREE|nr:hypothetical protein BCR39DRAFT_589368 [Naematelia encephala]